MMVLSDHFHDQADYGNAPGNPQPGIRLTHCRRVILELGESFDAVEGRKIARSFDFQTARLYQ
jgi:hypothetical protein